MEPIKSVSRLNTVIDLLKAGRNLIRKPAYFKHENHVRRMRVFHDELNAVRRKLGA